MVAEGKDLVLFQPFPRKAGWGNTDPGDQNS